MADARSTKAPVQMDDPWLRLMADGAPVMLWAAGAVHRRTRFNRGWLQFTGRTLRQESGAGWMKGVHPDDLARCKEILAASVEARQPYEMEYRLRRHDGVYRWLLERGAPHDDDDGRFAGFLGSCLDFTERRQLEEAGRESEEHHRMIFQKSPMPMWVYDIETLRFLAVNQAASQHYGYSEAEFLAMSIREIRHPDDLARFDEAFKVPGPARSPPVFRRHLKKTGEIIAVDVYAGSLHFAGRPARLVVVNDITESQRLLHEDQRLRAELGKAASEWSITFDALDTPVLLIGLDGRIQRMNRAARALTGQDAGEGGEPPPARESGAFPWPRVIELTKQAADARGSVSGQISDRRSARIWDCSAAYFENPGTGSGCVVVSAREITLLIRLQDEIRQAEMLAALGRLVAGVAHEVRNPLHGLSSVLDAFERRYGDDERFVKYTSNMRAECARLKRLMSDLLDFGQSRPQQLRELALDDVLRAALLSVEPLRLERGVRIHHEEAAHAVLRADADRLQQVFINLLENALQHTPSGGEIRIATAADQGGAVCVFRDDGPGIPAEALEQNRLFEPFFSLRKGGTGLGLSIVKRIMGDHGGAISVRNHAGGGAEFTLTFKAGGADAHPDH